MSKPSILRRVFSALWNGVTRVRVALSNILFLLLIAVIYFAYSGGAPEPLPERAALLLNLTGTVVDEKSRVQPLQAFMGEPSPADHEVLLRDVIESIEYAKLDPAISSLVMELDQLVYVGISKTHEIVRALESFRESGKPIVAVGDYYSQDQYLLASHADLVIFHPLGGVALVIIADVIELNAELMTVFAEFVYLSLGHRILDIHSVCGGGDIVVHC